MLKVALFTDADVFAGTERHMFDLGCALRDLGASVTIACPAPSPLAERTTAAGLPTLSIPKRGNVDFAAARTLTALLRSGNLDIIHAHNGRTHIAAAIAISRAGRGKLIATQHFLTPARAARRGIRAIVASILHRFAQSKTTHTIAISAAVRDEALRRRDAGSDQITVVHNGIPMPPLESLKPTNEVRHSLGLNEDSPFIFCAARLQKEKDLPTLISAMSQLPNAHCFIAGEGDEQASLQSQIDRLSLSPRVKLLGFRNDVLSLTRACDVFVLPSLAEPFGLAILEAMALARPVIATRAGGPLEIIDDNRSGLLVPPQSPEALAASLQQLLRSPDLRRSFGESALTRFNALFTADRMARQTLAIYRKALEPGNEPSKNFVRVAKHETTL